ncbi:MAG: signal peptidase II [Spirochaetes bacterium]|nr:signal peptidase II [Spirochaetota bacterium]
MKNRTFLNVTVAVLLINLLADRISKIAATAFLKDREVFSFLFGSFKMIYVENTGAFLSLGSHWPAPLKYAVFIIIPAAFCFYGIYYCIIKCTDIKMAVLLSTIIGGGLGNLIDRVIFDFKVVDFLNFGIGNLRTGVLNIADLSVTFGAILLIAYDLLKGRKPDITEEE